MTYSATTPTVRAPALLPWLGMAMRGICASTDPTGLSLVVLIVAILLGVIGYGTWTYALGHLGAARASNFLYLVASTAMAIALFVRDEVPVPSALLGGIIDIGGVVLVNISSRHASRTAPDGRMISESVGRDPDKTASPCQPITSVGRSVPIR